MKISYEAEESIALLTMDDGKANTMDFDFFEKLSEALNKAEKDSAKVLIIMGRPGFFSGGVDLKFLPGLTPKELNRFVTLEARTMLRIFSLPIPTIAACNGHAIGAGAMLAFSCDLRFGVDGPYRIHLNELLGGVPLMTWMILIGRSAIPLKWQTQALLHSRAYNPKQAFECNLLDALIKERDDIREYSYSMARELLNLNIQAYALTKKRMRGFDIKRALELLKDELPAEIHERKNSSQPKG